MSAANSQIPSSADKNLSAEARALLLELEGGASISKKNAALAEAFHARPEAPSDMGDVPVTLARPVNDTKAAAFAELLEHLDDEAGTPHGDVVKADKAAEKFRAERARPTAPLADEKGTPEANTDDMSEASELSADAAEPAEPMVDSVGASMDGDIVLLEEEEFGPADDEEFGPADDEDDFDFDVDEKPAGLKGFFARLIGGGRAVKRLVGVKDASSAYNAQSGASLVPYTIIRAVVLVLVAAVPPAVNLIIIQPQISDNNRKITETLSYEAKSKEDEKQADKLAKTITKVERRSKALLGESMPEEKLQPLVNNYVAALQRYGVDLNSYNVVSEKSRKVIVGDQVQDTMVVELDLVSRYDIYTEIRKVFAQQAGKMTVLDETLATQPGSVDLKVFSRVMIPVQRDYDAELDKPTEDGK